MTAGPVAAAEAPTVHVDLPAAFHPVPDAVAVEDRVHAVVELLDRLGVRDPRRREALTLYLQALSRTVRSGPVQATAFCAVELAGAASTAALGVALQHVGGSDPLVAATGAARVWRQDATPRPGRTVAVERRGTRLLAVRTEPADPAGGLAQASVLVLLDGTAWAALVTVLTPDAGHLDHYAGLARDVAASTRLARA